MPTTYPISIIRSGGYRGTGHAACLLRLAGVSSPLWNRRIQYVAITAAYWGLRRTNVLFWILLADRRDSAPYLNSAPRADFGILGGPPSFRPVPHNGIRGA